MRPLVFGLALILLVGLAVWRFHGARSRPLDLVPGLVVFNGCAVAILADTLLRGVHAPLLWPALALHSVLLIWCVADLAMERAARG